MALDLQLQALLVPFGTPFPGDVQGLLELIASYMEITGAQNFNGVNYGSTDPSPDDRDKAWFKTDGSGVPLGWYAWDGAEWKVLPGKAFVGDLAARDAITSPQNGTLYQLVGTGLYVFNSDANAWEAGFPAAEAQTVYDRLYFFDSQQSLASTGSTVGSWTALPLASFYATAGVTTAKAAIIVLEAGFTQSAFVHGGTDYAVDLRCWGDNTVSTSATDIAKVYARGSADDSRTSAYAITMAMVPIVDGNLYYTVAQTNAPPGAVAKVWLAGFVI